LDTETRLSRYADTDCWPTADALAGMLEGHAAAIAAVGAALPMLEAAVEEAAGRLCRGAGRIIYAGAGSSGRVAAQDAAELHPTFGWPCHRAPVLVAGGPAALARSIEGAEDDVGAGASEALALVLGPDDVVLAVAASGVTPYTRAVQATARRGGALAIALACNRDAPLLAEADHPVLLRTGPEFLAGSTRLAAATAQKVALNLFSTQLMVRLGRVYRGHMVAVVASNAKLVARARRMVAELAGCTPEAAGKALGTARNDVRLAVLLLDGLSPREAEARLQAAGGDLRRARPSPAVAMNGHGLVGAACFAPVAPRALSATPPRSAARPPRSWPGPYTSRHSS
jgi:N-acetylmuramic acid 6-phosphate etherase